MKKQIITILLLISSFFIVNFSYGAETKIPDEVFHKFIRSQNKKIPNTRIKDIVNIVNYYNPRYFGDEGLYNEGMIYVFSIMAQESNFRNVNSYDGFSTGYMQIKSDSCDIARKYNGIHRDLNLISMRENIWCGMAEINRLHEKLNGNWDNIIQAYNGGLGVIIQPKKFAKGAKQTKEYLKLVNKRKVRLMKYIMEYENERRELDRSK